MSSKTLLLLLALALFLPNLSSEYVWDDRLLVVLNPWTDHWSSLLNIWTQDLWHGVPGESKHNWYRPLMSAHLIVDQKLFGEALFPRQLISLGWHLTTVALLFSYVQRWAVSPSVLLLSVGFFALHPFQWEVNRFIAARNDSMGLCFALAAILSKGPYRAGFCALAAFLSKESTLLILPILLAGEWLNNRSIRHLLPSFGIAALLYGILRSFATLESPELSFASVFPVATTYLSCLWWPHQCPATRPPIELSINHISLIPIFFLLLLGQRHRPRLTVVAFIFLASGLFLAALSASTSFSMAHRYMHLPLLGVTLLLSAAIPARMPSGIAKITTIALALCSFPYAKSWSSSQQLWANSHARYPSPYTACGLFKEVEQQPDVALPLLHEAIATSPVLHCCYNATIYPLRVSNPTTTQEFGQTALTAGCPQSVELIAPLAMAEALLGNWNTAAELANRHQRDPFGFGPVILSAEGLQRSDRSPLQYWAQFGSGGESALEKKALLLLQKQVAE